MKRTLAWKPHLRAVVAGADRVFLLGDGEQFLLRGAPYVALAPLLDGRRTEAAVLTAAGATAEVLFALRSLEARGYVAEVAPLDDGVAALWNALGSDARTVAARLAARPVAVDGPDVMRDALVAAGLHVDAEAALRVVVTDDYLAIEPPRTGRWLPVRLGGLTPWIGPLFGAEGGPCLACLAHRLRWNRPVETWLARQDLVVPPLPPAHPGAARAAADLAALTLAWWIADGGTGAIDDHLIAFSLTELRATRHRVTRRPQCPACGDPALVAHATDRPVVLAARPRSFAADGGHRTVTPEETVARLEPLVSPITGVIASFGPVAGRDHPLRPVAGAVYRVTPRDADPGFDDFHRMSSGKGRTPIQARASALCEALERLSAIWHGDEVHVRRPLDDDSLPPDALQNFSAAQLAARDPADRSKHRVPLPYDPAEPLDWTPAWSLSHARRVYLPTAYCYQHAPHDGEVCVFNPNGHAAGNCLEEAILQGFLELAERDAVAIWWYTRLPAPGVDLASWDDPYFTALAAHYRELGHPLAVLDVTTDLEIPTFVAIAHGARPAVGFGCHLDARLAIQRALTELNQIWSPDPAAPAPWPALADDAFLRPSTVIRTARDYAAVPAGDLRDDVHTCVTRAAARGLETIVLDQSRPDLPLAAAKVVVPGLRHFWPRFGPGRLYHVPVLLGRLAAPLDESALNPVPLLL